MKSTCRSVIAASLVILASAAAHAGPGVEYWQNRAAAAKAAKTVTTSAIASKSDVKTAPAPTDHCSSSC